MDETDNLFMAIKLHNNITEARLKAWFGDIEKTIDDSGRVWISDKIFFATFYNYKSSLFETCVYVHQSWWRRIILGRWGYTFSHATVHSAAGVIRAVRSLGGKWRNE